MEPTPRHRTAERDFRQMLRTGGVAPPDRVAYAPDEIVFGWTEQKLAVVLELGSPPGCVPLPQPRAATPSPP